MEPHVAAAHKILDNMRRVHGVQHVYRAIDPAQFPHLSAKFYSKCEQKLNKLHFKKIMDIEDVTVRLNSPDPRTFLRILTNPESKMSAAIYQVKPKFPWPILMLFAGMPSKVYEFQSVFSDDTIIETTMSSPIISNSHPEKITKQFYPKKSIEELYDIHKRSADDYSSRHPGVNPVHIDSFQSFIDHDKKTFEMTRDHLERIGWVTKEYLYKQARKNKHMADMIYDEIQNILKKEKSINNITMNELKWLDNYSGQTTDELIALEGQYRTDSLVLAFEQALNQKAHRATQEVLTEEDIVVLAIEALEREVNNGGYHQLFVNASKEYAPFFVAALNRIGCNETAALTQQAIDILGTKGPITIEAIESIMEQENVERDERLSECDNKYYQTAGDLAGPLLEFIKSNREKINLK